MKAYRVCTYIVKTTTWWEALCLCVYISVWLCMPVSEQTYLLSNARGWVGWRTMLRRQSQKWSLSSGLLWRLGCFLWSTWEPEFDPAGRSCPWRPGLLCLETLDWWKQTGEKKNRSQLHFRKVPGIDLIPTESSKHLHSLYPRSEVQHSLILSSHFKAFISLTCLSEYSQYYLERNLNFIRLVFSI